MSVFDNYRSRVDFKNVHICMYVHKRLLEVPSQRVETGSCLYMSFFNFLPFIQHFKSIYSHHACSCSWKVRRTGMSLRFARWLTLHALRSACHTAQQAHRRCFPSERTHLQRRAVLECVNRLRLLTFPC